MTLQIKKCKRWNFQSEDLKDFDVDDGRNDSTPEGWKEGGKEEETVADKGAKLKELDQAHASCQELQTQLIQMLQAELEMLNEEPSEQTELLNQESGTAALSEELQTSLLEKQASKLQNELADMNSHEGHASEGTQQRPGTGEGPGGQDGADRARDQDQGASPADGAGSGNMGGEKERVDGATNRREVRELKGLLRELQTILDGSRQTDEELSYS